MWAVLLIILVLVAWMSGDPSGVEMIIKIIVVGGLILGALWLIAFVPWLVFIIVILGIVYAFINNKKSDYNNINNRSNYIDESAVSACNKDINTKFKEELKQNTKTPDEVLYEVWLRESKETIKLAEINYNQIKLQLLSKAKAGEYLLIGDKRYIINDYKDDFISKCIKRDYHTIYTYKILGGKKYSGSVTYEIKDFKLYNLYLNTLSSLAFEDGIDIIPVFIEKCMSETKSINMPYVYEGPCSLTHEVKTFIKCSIEY